MKIFQTPSYDRFSLLDAEKKNANFKSMKDVSQCENIWIDDVKISEEGIYALRARLKEIKPEVDEPEVYELTVQDTNEVAWEHYTAMMKYSGLTLQDGNYNLEDVMKSMMDAYETRYNQIVKEHENGNRKVSYDLTGESELTLEEDLEGLDRAYNMRLANMEGYIFCQQTNDALKFLHSTHKQYEARAQEAYRDTAVDMMEQAHEKFLELRERPDYKQKIAVGIIWGIMSDNADFMEQTRKLFAKTIQYSK